MKLKKLLNGVNYEGEVNNVNVEINGIAVNDNFVQKGYMFIAVKGENSNGNNYILSAIKNGAVAIVTDDYDYITKLRNENKITDKITVIIAKNIRIAVSKIAYNYYNPLKSGIKVIGVVGTNGKTSVTYILSEILKSAGKKVGIIGTLGVNYAGKQIAPSLTTPDSLNLYEIIADMGKNKIEYVIMEYSAHAISQKRANDIKFEVLIFTNCTHDHLDYFKTFKNYESTKTSVFNEVCAKYAVVNADSKTGRDIIFSEKIPLATYGINEPSDVFAVDIKLESNRSSYYINAFDNVSSVKTNLIGEFNVYNALASITTAEVLGVKHSIAIESVKNMQAVKGRLEFVENYNGADIFVDYAHTPDGLEKLLKSARKFTKNNLHVLFGCGGNRDKEKRSEMGKIAGSLADFTIITSDNPRYEEPYTIIREIESGVRQETLKYITIQNRYMATGYAIAKLKKGDTLILAGKGAEKYQEIMGVKLSYSDSEAVRDIIAKLDFGGELI